MRILVTGAKGFLGSAVTAYLRTRGHAVIAASRHGGDDAVAADLSNADAVADLLAVGRPTAIVNCAVVADFGPSCFSRLYPVNVALPAMLAQWCADSGAHLVQASGTLVHGSAASRVVSGMPLAPDCDYGKGKLLADQLIVESACSHSILRFGGLFGQHGPAHLGLNRVIRAARNGQTPTIVGQGRARRNYLHPRDAARMIEFCLLERASGTFYCGGSEINTIAEMLTMVCDLYLPGRAPLYTAGTNAQDQIVETTHCLPLARAFRVALEDDR